MDLHEIREIIELEGGKFIIVENGRPTMVIISFEEYKDKLKSKKKDEKKDNPKPLPKELQGEELTIEDLPL